MGFFSGEIKESVARMGGRISRSRNFVLWSNMFFMLVAIGLIIFALLLVVGVSEVRSLTITGPNFFYYTIGALGLFIFIVSFFGVLGVIRRKKGVLLCYTLSAAGLLLIEIIITVFGLLYANGQAAFPEVDNLAGSLLTELENSLVRFAETDPSEWKLTQDALGCCGVDFESTYRFSEFNKTASDFLQSQLSGEGCSSEYPNILAVQENFTSFEAAAEERLLELLANDNYFCIDSVRAFLQQATIAIAGSIGGVVAFQFIALVCCYILLCDKGAGKGDDGAVGETNEFYHAEFVETGQTISNTLKRKKKKKGAAVLSPPLPPRDDEGETITPVGQFGTTGGGGYSSGPPPPPKKAQEIEF